MSSENKDFHLTRRQFFATAGAAGAGYLLYRGVRFQMPSSDARARVVIVGGGAAGISVAARLQRALSHPDITLIDPAPTHFYQPGFTLVAAGVFDKDAVHRAQSGLVPSKVRWIQDQVVEADPDHNRVITAAGGPVPYDFLVLCPGLQMNFDAIEGIRRESIGEGNAHCIYDYQGAQKCWPAIQALSRTGGRAIFSDTWTKFKCGGAPKKINLIADDLCRRAGMRCKVDFHYYCGVDHLFDAPVFKKRVDEIYVERGIPVAFNHRIQSVDTARHKATFVHKQGEDETRVTVDYDFLHLVPPMSAPDFVRRSPLAVNPATGKSEDWVPADKTTLVHARYRNVVTLGDVAGLPTSKTAAAIRAQAPLAAANLISLMEGRTPGLRYDGYTACPVVTEYGKVLMAEFGYDKKPAPTLPLLNPAREHAAGWWLKVHVLRPMYFDGMLKGLA